MICYALRSKIANMDPGFKFQQQIFVKILKYLNMF